MKNETKRTLKKRIISAVLSGAFLTQSLPMPYLADGYKWMKGLMAAHAEDNENEPEIDPEKIATWKSTNKVDLADFALFSQYYHYHPTEFQNEEITLTFTNATDTIPTGFISLGTTSYPFNGKLIINIAPGDAPNKQLKVTTPIFEAINDTVQIVYNDATTPIELDLIRTNNKTESEASSLLANQVMDGTGTSAVWKVKSSVYSSGSEQYAYAYSGVVGTIADDAEVSIYYNNNSVGSWVTSSESVGLVCGSMGEYSKLHAYLSGANTGYTVKSTAGNAGGLVGEMSEGAELDVYLEATGSGTDCYNLSDSKTITTVVEGSPVGDYAGGLVGMNDGGRVAIQKRAFENNLPKKDASNNPVYESATYTCTDTISALTGAGGLFGYYKNSKTKSGSGNSATITTDNVTFDLSKMTSGTGSSVSAANVGGLFGILDTIGNVKVTNGSISIMNNGSDNNFGGIVGALRTSNLTNTFLIGGSDGSVSVTTENAIVNAEVNPTTSLGGAIGIIDGNVAAYVNVDNFTSEFINGYDTSGNYGGVVGNAGEKGSMLDIGTVTVKDYVSGTGNAIVYGGVYKNGGGIVGKLSTGVLRLSGTTDLEKTTAFTSDNSSDIREVRRTGQLVGERGDSLVYAVGSGNTAPEANILGWGLKRSSTAVAADDIATWGEVVRIADVETRTVPTSSTTAALYFDTVAHKVYVQSSVVDMSTPMQFVRTALNMQLNSGEDVGALCFSDTSTSSKTSLLANQSLKITGKISLSNTGITGFMRDGCIRGWDLDKTEETDIVAELAKVGVFTGKLTGVASNSVAGEVEFATGQSYGIGVTDATTAIGKGRIYNHTYNGLFARTDTGASINSLKLSGTLCASSQREHTYVGGFVALSEGGITLSAVTADESIDVYSSSISTGHYTYVGGMIGAVGSNNTNDIQIENSTISPDLTWRGSMIDAYNNGHNASHAIGGAIGRIDSGNAFTTKFKNVTLSAEIDAKTNVGNTSAMVSASGLIADITGSSTHDRTVELDGVVVDGTVIKNKATSYSGGILGSRWYNTNVNFTERTTGSSPTGGVLLQKTGTNNNSIDTGAAHYDGLIYYASGRWQVAKNGLTINNLNAASTGSSSFGIIANEGKALFLEMKDKDSYNPGTSNGIPTNTTVYDDFVAYNMDGGVISITTDGALSMTSSKCNTWQNHYNKSKTNEKTRYYYNLTEIGFKADGTKKSASELSSDEAKLMMWSLNKYATTGLKKYFTNAYTVSGQNDKIEGTFNLLGYSYYPVPAGNVDLGDVTIQFYNQGIEDAEVSATGNTDKVDTEPTYDGKRSTRTKTQHYLMHSGLFTTASSITVTGDLRFKGNIGADSTHHGVLVNSSLTGGFDNSNKKIVLEGITMSDAAGALLINKIEASTNISVKVNGVRAGGVLFSGETLPTGYTESAYSASAGTVAQSLIGDVTGSAISMEFKKIKLDSRTASTTNSSLTALYGTSQSLFSHATLLESYKVDTPTAIYNYSSGEDWNGTTHIADVTYGREIDSSMEFLDKEHKYYGEGQMTYALATEKSTEGGTDFSSGYRPYVYTAYNTTNGTHEIKVNVYIAALNVGCGTYNHPYVINDGALLANVASFIYDQTSFIPTVRLPNTVATTSNTYNSHWCTTPGSSCAEYTCASAGANYTGGTNNWTTAQVREYLASAYYLIQDDSTDHSGLTINDNNFPGLGTFGNSGAYMFRGVIKGEKYTVMENGESVTKNPKIINNTDKPLINFSSGAVVKDVDIQVTGGFSFIQNPTGSTARPAAYSIADDNTKAYGAVIGKIFAGDNIIDNVSVTYSSAINIGLNENVVISGKTDDTNNARNAQCYSSVLGGYVGTIVDGCLMFRNMDSTTAKLQTTGFNVNCTGLYRKSGNKWLTDVNRTSVQTNSEDGKRFLYVNPIIGRVINGFAVYETDTYRYSEDGKYGNGDTRSTGANGTVSLKNGRKNYSIADIYKDSSVKLDFNSDGTEIYAADAQSLYILAGILQTGAGSAKGITDDYDYTTAYNGRYAGIHHADYTYVGDTDNAISEKTIIEDDKVYNKKAVPYIIYHYTEAKSGNYPARIMARTNIRSLYLCALSEKSSSVATETYWMPDGFRGIGSMSTDNTTGKGLKLSCFNGKNKQVDMNISVNYYNNSHDNYYTNNYNFGTALFCELEQDGISTAPQSSADKTIGNVILSGYTASSRYVANSFALAGTDHRVYNGGLIGFSGSNLNIGNVTFSDLSLQGGFYNGGLLGHPSTKGNIYVNNCTTDSANGKYLRISNGIKNGGYLSDIDDASLFVNTLSADSECTLKIEIEGREISGESYCGGIIGKLWGGKLYVRNVTIEPIANGTSYIGVSDNFSATNSSAAAYNAEANIPNAGGIIGVLTKGTVIVTDCNINNMIIRGFSASGIVGYNHMKRDAYYSGKNETQNVKIYNCEVNGCTIRGNYAAGGLIGVDDGTYSLHTNNTQNQDAITASKYYTNDIDHCTVKNTTIEHKNSGGSTGGLIGRYNIIPIQKNLEKNAKSDDKIRIICNSKVENCKLISPSGSSTGGFVGVADDTILYGYNLIFNESNSNYGFKMTSDTSPDVTYKQKAGNFIGSALATAVVNYDDKTYVSDIRFIGVSRQGDFLIDKTSGSNLNDPDISERAASNVSASVIYADYEGASLEIADATAVRSGLTDVAAANDLSANLVSPYVLISPKKQMGATEYLTSDGAATYLVGGTVKPLADEIAGDISSVKKYQNVSSTDLTRINAALSATNDNVNRIQTYQGAMLTLPGSGTVSDFPVVVINSISKTDSTALIQSYIRLMTNTSSTDYSFSTNKEHSYIKYDINKIYACTFDGTNYSINSSANPGLRYDIYNSQGRFYMNVGSADSNQPESQFSLIDVVFYDPSDTTNTKVAYHLYVPVLTKKMVTIDFQSASLSGTDMKPSSYATPGNTILENSGTWITSYVSFTYEREELESLLNGGIPLDWNHEKQVGIKKVTGGFPDTTKVMLLDPNGNADKVYYATYGGVGGVKTGTSSEGDDIIELRNFSRTDTVEEAGVTQEDTTYFTPRNLGDLVTITATTDGSNKHYIDLGTTTPEVASGDVVVKASNGHYYKFTENEAMYALAVNGDLQESYYISFFVPNDGTLHHVDLRCPGTLPANENDRPLGRVSDLLDAKLTKIIVGDLYDQSNVSIAVYNDNDSDAVPQTPASSGQNLMDDDHSIIHVSLSTQVSLKENVQSTISGNTAANSQLRLYQSFIIYMDKTELADGGNTTTKLISGNAPVTAKYSSNGTTWSDSDNLTASGAYIKLGATDITDELKANSGAGIATLYAKVAMNYTSDDNRNAEFPERTATTGQNDIGVNVSAKSNLASGSQDLRLVYSNISATPNIGDDHHFYIKKKASTSLKYSARKDKLDKYDKDGSTSFNYSQLGLNGSNLAIPSQYYIPIYSTATYDASNFEQISSADKLRYEFTLYKKTDDDGDVKYIQIANADLGDYLRDASLTLQITDGLADKESYIIEPVNGTFTKDYLLGNNDKSGDYAADVYFEVNTGGNFHDYANYRMKLKVSLIKTENSTETELASAESWIVYTNAKIDPTMHNN